MATKEDARKFIQERAAERKPLPEPKELKRQMGWDLIKAAQKAAQAK